MMRKRFKRQKKTKQSPQNQPTPQENSNPNPFELLPPEIILYLCSFLKTAELAAFSLSCSFFNAIAQDDLRWKNFLAYTDKKCDQKTNYRGLFFSWAKENGFFASPKIPAQPAHDDYSSLSLFTMPYGDTKFVKVEGNVTIVSLLADKEGNANCFFEFYENSLPYVLRLYLQLVENEQFSIRASYLSAQKAKECNESMPSTTRVQEECIVPGCFYYEKIKALAKEKKSIVFASKQEAIEWLQTFLLTKDRTKSMSLIERSEQLSMQCLWSNFRNRAGSNHFEEKPEEHIKSRCNIC